MMNKKCNFKIGAALMLSTALSCANVSAQTCTVPPTCESLGYDKSESECSDAIKTLHCPLDKTKVFCLTAEEVVAAVGSSGGNPGTKVAEIGDIVYTDTISANPIPGRVPVGIVYDISGKMVSIAEYGKEDKCSAHIADGTTNWTLASMEDMGSIKANVDKINATIQKIGNSAPSLATTYTSSDTFRSSCYLASNGQACMLSGKALTDEDTHGCDRCQDVHYWDSVSKSRCVRKFGPNGANDVASTPAPTPATTYAVGDAYKDSEGNIIGTVVAVDSSKQHGTIAYAEGSGTSSDAGIKCSQKTTGGKAWTLASGAHACTLLKTAGSCSSIYSTFCEFNTDNDDVKVTCGLHASEGQGRCLNSKWYLAGSEQTKTSCAISDSLTYVCTTTF